MLKEKMLDEFVDKLHMLSDVKAILNLYREEIQEKKS